MITPEVIRYSVTDSDIDFSIITDSESEAKAVNENLKRTKRLIEVLSKYYELEEITESSCTGYSTVYNESYYYDNTGLLIGIKVHMSSICKDENEKVIPRLSNRYAWAVTGREFIDIKIRPIISAIEETISQLEEIVPSKEQYSALPESVFNVVKNEITSKTNDINIIKEYYGIA